MMLESTFQVSFPVTQPSTQSEVQQQREQPKIQNTAGVPSIKRQRGRQQKAAAEEDAAGMAADVVRHPTINSGTARNAARRGPLQVDTPATIKLEAHGIF